MDTVCSLQYQPGVLLEKSIYFIFTGFHTEPLAHSQETCEISRSNLNQPLNLSISVLHHSKNQGNNQNFPELRSIHKIFPLGSTCQSFYF